MNIPSLHQIQMLVDNDPHGNANNKEKTINPDYLAAQNQMVEQLQKNLSNEGFMIPRQPSDTITKLNTAQSVGALIYNSTTKQLMVNIDGTFKVVQVI